MAQAIVKVSQIAILIAPHKLPHSLSDSSSQIATVLAFLAARRSRGVTMTSPYSNYIMKM